MLEAEKQQKLESETHCAGGQAQPAKPRTAHNALPSDPIPSANALTPAPPFQQPLLFGTSPAAGHPLQFVDLTLSLLW